MRAFERGATLTFLCGVLLALSCSSAYAEAGRIAALSGSAQVLRGTANQTLSRGSLIEVGDVLETAAASSLQLTMTNGEEIYLRPGTRFVVEAYSPPANRADPGRSFYSLLRGGLRAVTKALVRRDLDSYRMATPVATIGIRGTIYDLMLDDGLYTGVVEGEIGIANGAGSLNTVVGQYSYTADANTPPRLLQAVPPQLSQGEAGAAGAAAGPAAGKSASGVAAPVGIGAAVLGLAGVIVNAAGDDDSGGGTATGGTGTGGTGGTAP